MAGDVAQLINYPIYKLMFVTTFEVILFLLLTYIMMFVTHVHHTSGGTEDKSIVTFMTENVTDTHTQM